MVFGSRSRETLLEKPALTQITEAVTSNLSEAVSEKGPENGSRNVIGFVGDGGGFGCRELMLFPGNLILPKSALCQNP